MLRRFVHSSAARWQNVASIQKPTGTGQGPFIELPKFAPMGSSGRLLNVTLPRGTALNIRSGSMVAIDGDMLLLTSVTKWLTPATDYQELLTHETASIVINGHTNYTVVEAQLREKWTVLKDTSILAWSGYGMTMEPVLCLDKYNSFRSDGAGTVVLGGDRAIYGVDLGQHETLLVNPSALVATTGTFGLEVVRLETLANLDGVKRTWRRFSDTVRRWTRRISVPAITIPKFKLPAELDGVRKWFRAAGKWIDLYIFSRFGKPIYLKVQGPARVLLENAPHIGNKTFSMSERRKMR